MDDNQQETYTLIEFFAGIGGAGIALAPAFKTALANDNSPLKAAVFRQNHPDVPFDERSIKEVRAVGMTVADLFWVSFPCVNHSALGDGAGLKGMRASLVFDVSRILGEHSLLGTMPPVVCCENVTRFASHAESRDFAALVQTFLNLGYRVGAVVIDADRFRPVLRKRLFIVAIRRDVVVPSNMLLKKPDPAWHPAPLVQAVARLPLAARREWLWLTMPQPDAPVPSLAELLDDDDGHAWFKPDRVERILAGCRAADVADVERMRADSSVLGIIAAQRTDRREGCTPALPIYTDGIARCFTAGRARQLVLRADPTGVRIRDFSGRELARLSGLPDDFVLPDALSSAVKCIGDGLSIPVVAWLGKHVLAPLVKAAREVAVVRPGTETKAAVTTPPTRNRRDEKDDTRTGIKRETSATSLYLYREDLDRLHRHAANDGAPLHEWVLRQLDGCLARRGEQPLRRHVSKRGKQRPTAANDVGASQDTHRAFERLAVTGEDEVKPFFGRGPSTHVEWYTPKPLLARILKALGREQFDVDAFSPGMERSPVPAIRYITREEDALERFSSGLNQRDSPTRA